MNSREPLSGLPPYENRGPQRPGAVDFYLDFVRRFQKYLNQLTGLDSLGSFGLLLIYLTSLECNTHTLKHAHTHTQTHTHKHTHTNAHTASDCMQCNQYLEPIYYSIQLNDY